MRNRSTIRRQVWISVPLALTLFFGQTDLARAQVAPKESSSRLIHRFPPLPDIVQRKAEIDAKRNRTGLLTKMLTPNPSANRSIIEIDLDLAFKKKKNNELLVQPQTKTTPEPSKEPTVESDSKVEPEIVTTSHQEPAEESDQDELPPLPEVEPAVEPTLPASSAPTLRSASAEEESDKAESDETTEVEQGELPPPTATGSMKAPTMRRDRRRQEMQQPTKTTAEAPPTQTLPRTLPEMDAPPIRKAITKEQADAAQRDLEKKLLSVTKQPELTLPELPTEVEPAAPTKSQEISAPKLPQAPQSDDLAAARDELHRLAKPIPVADPSLELAAEELKQLAESEELQDAAASATTPPPTKPGLNFARDAVSTKGIEKPSPIQPVSSEVATKSKPATLDAPPAINLPPVSLDSPPLPVKAASVAPAPAKKVQKDEIPPAATKDNKPAASEPTLKPIPPAASTKPDQTTKPVVLDVTPTSTGGSTTPIAEQKPKSSIPRLRREPDSSAVSSTTPAPISIETKTADSTKPATTAHQEATSILHLPEVPAVAAKPALAPTTKSKTVAQKTSAPPPNWRPVMPPRSLPADQSAKPEVEFIQTSGQISAPTESNTPSSVETNVAPPAPRILAPIEADDLGKTSTQSILMPGGEKPTRVDFSRSLAARAIDTLATSRGRTARERALADLHRMDLWFKAEGSLDAVKQVALADERLLMRQAAVEVLAATPTSEKQIDRVLADIAATNSEGSIRQQAREAISQRNRDAQSTNLSQ